jgi:hypothetical protein
MREFASLQALVSDVRSATFSTHSVTAVSKLKKQVAELALSTLGYSRVL